MPTESSDIIDIPEGTISVIEDSTETILGPPSRLLACRHEEEEEEEAIGCSVAGTPLAATVLMTQRALPGSSAAPSAGNKQLVGGEGFAKQCALVTGRKQAPSWVWNRGATPLRKATA